MAEEKAKQEKEEASAVTGLDPKYLQGLVFKGAEKKVVDEDGVKKTKGVPYERPLKMEDVLSWADKGATVVIVTGDGRKYNIEKNPKKGR